MNWETYQQGRTLRNRLTELRADQVQRQTEHYFVRIGIKPYHPAQRVVRRGRTSTAVKFMALAALLAGGVRLGRWLGRLLW